MARPPQLLVPPRKTTRLSRTKLAQRREGRRRLQHVGARQVPLHLVNQHEAELVVRGQRERGREVARPLLRKVLASRQLHSLIYRIQSG